MKTRNKTGGEYALDWKRIRRLLKLGLLAGVIVLAGDMLLGWGVTDESLSGMEQFLSGYRDVSTGRLVWAALLGLVGIPLEGVCYFAVYRMMAARAERHAHLYRAGILGYLTFGACGLHVPCCAMIWTCQRFAEAGAGAAERMTQFALYFLVPAAVLFLLFFFLLIAVQAHAFAAGLMPLPRWGWIFSLGSSLIAAILLGLLGNCPPVNALSTGWISLGNLWMFGGLLILTRSCV